jgi:hypothetical protein
MRDTERHNQREIDRLNQRGGRMLSLTDLLDAGTVALEMAAEMACVAARGGSFLTAAGPGGVGKTTLMGALLAFLPPGTRILPVDSERTLLRLADREPEEPECLVVHEIGAGPYYAYLWGPAVAQYFEVATGPDRTLASNLHAETYEEAVTQLTGSPLGVSHEALGRIDLLAFMARHRGQRRVTEVRRAVSAGGHECTWRWLPADDGFERTAPPEDEQFDRFRDFLRRAHQDRCLMMEDLRARALEELFRGGA